MHETCMPRNKHMPKTWHACLEMSMCLNFGMHAQKRGTCLKLGMHAPKRGMCLKSGMFLGMCPCHYGACLNIATCQEKSTCLKNGMCSKLSMCLCLFKEIIPSSVLEFQHFSPLLFVKITVNFGKPIKYFPICLKFCS